MRNSNSWRRTLYRERIEKLAPGYDPAHVEAWMRFHCDGGDIESMSTKRFHASVAAAQAVLTTILAELPWVGLEELDRLAKSFGLKPKKRRKEVSIFPRGCVLGIIEIEDIPNKQDKRRRKTK